MRSHARRILTFGTTIAVLAIWVVLLRPQALGGPASYIVIRGTSMLPTYQNGDLVIMQSAPAYTVGDAIAYRVPSGEIGEGHVIVHRISSGNGTDGFLVQGDNNNAIDPWMPRAGDIAGSSWLVVPGVGRVVAFIHQPIIAGGLAAGVIVTLILAGQSRPRTPPVLPGRTDRASTRRNRRQLRSRATNDRSSPTRDSLDRAFGTCLVRVWSIRAALGQRSGQGRRP